MTAIANLIETVRFSDLAVFHIDLIQISLSLNI